MELLSFLQEENGTAISRQKNSSRSKATMEKCLIHPQPNSLDGDGKGSILSISELEQSNRLPQLSMEKRRKYASPLLIF